MRFRRRKKGPSPETQEAAARLAEAVADRDQALRDDDQVDRVASATERLARRNRLGPMITDALRGSR